MKKSIWVVGLLAGTVSFAADTSSTAPQSNASPKDVCNSLVDAAKKNDQKTVQMWVAPWAGGQYQRQSAGQAAGQGQTQGNGIGSPRHQQLVQTGMAFLKGLSCGSDHTAGTKAFVEVKTATGEPRFLPFTQDSGQWKLDARTYMSFYRDMMGKMTS